MVILATELGGSRPGAVLPLANQWRKVRGELEESANGGREFGRSGIGGTSVHSAKLLGPISGSDRRGLGRGQGVRGSDLDMGRGLARLGSARVLFRRLGDVVMTRAIDRGLPWNADQGRALSVRQL